MPELFASKAGQLDSEIGPLFVNEEIIVRNGTTGTSYSAGDFVLFDIGLNGNIATTMTEGLEESGFACVITPSENSSEHLAFCPGALLLEDLPPSAAGVVSKGRALLRGIGTASVRASVDLVAKTAGGKLIGIADSVYLDSTTGSGNQKFYGILAGDMATTGPESVQILFDGVTGFR